MRISYEKLKKLCRERDISLSRLLRDAGVSRNAFYSLARKDSVLPKSLTAISASLDVSPFDFLVQENPHARKTRSIHVKAEGIVSQNARVDYDNIIHTLLLLEEKPLERLRRSLLRAQKPDLQ